MKLNLGCGDKRMPGYVNVDKYPVFGPDVVCDLETAPWPFEDDCAEEIVLSHVLEHLGATPETFFSVVRELYRVAKPGAAIHIRVPHPRNDDFLDDPTHVRPIMPGTLMLFDREQNLEWERIGAANSRLALALDVDFAIETWEFVVVDHYRQALDAGTITMDTLWSLIRERNNIVKEIAILWRVRKRSAP